MFRVALIVMLWSFLYVVPTAAYLLPGCGADAPDQAVLNCEEFVRKNPTRALAYFLRAIAYVRAGDDDHALLDLNKSIALHSDVPDRFYGKSVVNAYYHRGLLYNRRGDYRRALDDFSTLAALGPIDYRAFVARGVTYSEIGDHDAAVADFVKGIKLSPKGTAAYTERDGILKDMGRDIETDSDFAKAKELAEH